MLLLAHDFPEGVLQTIVGFDDTKKQFPNQFTGLLQHEVEETSKLVEYLSLY